MRILTAGCSRFRDPIQLNIKQAERFGYDVSVFDLGGLEIDGSIDHEIDDPEFKAKARYHRVPGLAYSAKSLHKGEIIQECQEENPDDLIVYMDGDAMMSQDLDDIPTLLDGCDIGVTVRDAMDMNRSLGKPSPMREFLGTFNAGIIVFNGTDKAKSFVKEWSSRIDKCQSDQRALNLFINPTLKEFKVGDVITMPCGTKVKCLDGGVYNFGYFPEHPGPEVRIIHCKGLRFRGRMDVLHSICRGTAVLPLRNAQDDFEGMYEEFPFEPHSISNVEAYYIWALIKKYKPDCIIESGICKGRSTHVIAEACRFYNIPFHICLEYSREHEDYIREKFKDYNIEFHYGQKSDIAMENIVPKIKGYRTLAFVDGPKRYDQSMDLYKQLKRCNTVAIYAHDCSEAGGCAKALRDARAKYWQRAELLITNKKTNVGLERFNSSIEDELQNAYLNVKDHWSKKLGRELTYDDYCQSLAAVGICEIEGK